LIFAPGKEKSFFKERCESLQGDVMSNELKGMSDQTKFTNDSEAEIELLRACLQKAEEALEAIRSGSVDAPVASSTAGEQIFTLQGAEHPYRVMVEAMNEGAATLLRDGIILYANPRLSAILDETLETLIGSTILDYIPAEDAQVFAGLIEHGFTNSGQAEIRFRRRNRSSVPVFISVSPTQVEGAKAVCIVMTDLTEQKRSQEIVAAERLARSILDQANDAILVCDITGKISRANHKALGTFSRNPLYQYFEQVVPLVYQHPKGRHFSITSVLSGESFQEIEAEYRSDPGENRFFLLSAAPLHNSQDAIIGCIVTLTEMTERKRLEERLAVQAGQLEQSNKELEDFAFVASHDLQEPLRKIESFGELLNKQVPWEGTKREYVQRMQDAARRMRKMIDDLLDLSRVTTRSKPFEPVDLEEVARRVVDDLESRLGQSKGQVILHALPTIDADEMQMQHLLQNLVGNALKYHQPSIPPVVQIGYIEKLPGWVELYVQDNGIGFDLKHMDEIFLPFHRLHGRGEFEGTGIGLSICRKIVQRHGGSITATSVIGEGSTFYVILPEKQV
jgi:two-component system sensor kinase FixL